MNSTSTMLHIITQYKDIDRTRFHSNIHQSNIYFTLKPTISSKLRLYMHLAIVKSFFQIIVVDRISRVHFLLWMAELPPNQISMLSCQLDWSKKQH